MDKEERVKKGEDPNPVPRKVINHYAREHPNFDEIVTKSDGTHPRWFRDLVLEYMNEEYDERLTLVREGNRI